MESDGNPYETPVATPDSASRAPRAAVAAHLLTPLFFLLLCVGPFAWILRDGLGPGATSSFGWLGLTRMFWCFYWGPLLIACSVLLAAALRRIREREA